MAPAETKEVACYCCECRQRSAPAEGTPTADSPIPPLLPAQPMASPQPAQPTISRKSVPQAREPLSLDRDGTRAAPALGRPPPGAAPTSRGLHAEPAADVCLAPHLLPVGLPLHGCSVTDSAVSDSWGVASDPSD